MAEGEAQPIIKKVKKVSGGGHHGGAWKVAYADFVTAMMAFFLLMWLLNATSEEQRSGIADFFSPAIPISDSSAGGTGMFGGNSTFSSKDFTDVTFGGSRDAYKKDKEDPEDGDADAKSAETSGDSQGLDGDQPGAGLGDLAGALQRRDGVSDEQNGERLFGAGPREEVEAGFGPDPEREAGFGPDPDDNEGFGVDDADGEGAGPTPLINDANALSSEEIVQRALENAMNALQQSGDENELLDHLSLKVTPEGLMVEIADRDGAPLFAIGSAQPSQKMLDLIAVIAPIVQSLANPIAIAGHTDASPFAGRGDYGNWELSSDRANAARRLLVGAGFPIERIARVSGSADRDLLNPDDPNAPQNRRIAITLLRSPE